MKPRNCNRCGAPAVYPPATFDLSAMVSCKACGADQGSWRAFEALDMVPKLQESLPKSDLRTARRIRSILGARIVFNRQCSAIECTVRDLSHMGAKLVVSPHAAIPDEFDLDIPKKARTYRSRLMWRQAGTCGVRFI
jgi:hypothetical protein